MRSTLLRVNSISRPPSVSHSRQVTPHMSPDGLRLARTVSKSTSSKDGQGAALCFEMVG